MLDQKEEYDISDETLYYNMLGLIGAIFRLAAQDMKYNRKEEVIEFIESEWFIDLCDYLNLEVTQVRTLICSSRVLQREEYH